jgi:transcriptional regulator with XRE-family HTH domain
MTHSSSVVAAWDLGIRLREKRELLGLNGRQLSAKAGIAPSYLSAVEKGKQHFSEEKLATVAKLLEFDKSATGELLRLRSQAVVRGWWTKFSALFNEELLRFFGFEHGAESVRTYDGGLVPGLLQTERYARAIIEAGAPNVRLAEVDRRVQARIMRQDRLTGPEPLHLFSVMGEAALRQQVGGPDVLAEQLGHLSRLITDHPDTIDIRIVPFTATGNHTMGGSTFYILAFPGGALPTLVWQETVTSTQLIDDFQMVREYALAHATATQSTLDRKASLAMINRLAKETR